MNFGVPTVVPWIFGDTEFVDNTEVVVGVDTREGSGINTVVGFVETTGCTKLLVLFAPASAWFANFSALKSAKLIAITSH